MIYCNGWSFFLLFSFISFAFCFLHYFYLLKVRIYFLWMFYLLCDLFPLYQLSITSRILRTIFNLLWLHFNFIIYNVFGLFCGYSSNLTIGYGCNRRRGVVFVTLNISKLHKQYGFKKCKSVFTDRTFSKVVNLWYSS